MCTAQAPCVRIASVGPVDELDQGRHYAFFNVTLSPAPTASVDVNLLTADGTARAGEDYLRTSRLERFYAGETKKQIWVDVIGDNLPEAHETFYVDVASVSAGAQVVVGRAQGTILDDDATPPLIWVSNASVTEGDSGTRNMNFKLSLSRTPLNPVTLQWSTDATSGTAEGGTDYVGSGGQVIFPAGTTTLDKTLSVPVRGDRLKEGLEWFHLKLINVQGAYVDR